MRTKKLLLILALLLTAVTGAWADDGIYCTASDVGRVVCTDGSNRDHLGKLDGHWHWSHFRARRHPHHTRHLR